MITKVTYDIGASQDLENDMYRHIGKLASRMAGVDEAVTIILSRAVSPVDPSLAIEIFESIFFATKLGHLKKAIPSEWKWKKPLLAWMQKVEDHRNVLAHSSVHIAYGITQESVRTLLRNKGKATDVSTNEFEHWEAKADVLLLVTTSISREPAEALLLTDVRALALELSKSGKAALAAAVDDMFPEESN